ncbi:hypothetical protein HF1_01790 [Mycoplasma haemofelis str. Langford 1]|uniref:Lipoprotein n=2 Tax=Mycoplasma haemofelis TaxID=29501 RepID=F6FGB6_MYCHI|nr:hypothetical protein [Mycoplasma haemofelis]AEG72506.1 hypothetical protein MHF_0207 [Mycoplasma haemofelis Ohio2]CBY92187.1 hypothetical protein HF1_01790 [Mycoplasma haemofelis str. Langford 1]
MNPKSALLTTLGASAGVAGACGGGYLLMKEKTIGDRVSKSGLILIKSGNSKAWKLAFQHSKLSDTSLIEDLTKLDSSIKSNSTINLEKAQEALDKWCRDAINKELSESNISNYLQKVKSRCTTPPTSIGEKLNREGKAFTSHWGNKFAAIKGTTSTDNQLESDLKSQDTSIQVGISDSNSPADKYSSALQKWCESQLTTKIGGDNYEDIYTKVSSRCI